MITCPACGRENRDDRDFCECGEYLRWEQTQVMSSPPAGGGAPAETEEQPAAGKPAGARPGVAPQGQGAIDPVTIELREPEGETAPGGAVTARARPGETGTLKAVIRNQSGIVDNYELRVEGIDPSWWSTEPETVYLVPFGSAGTYEDEVEIRFQPPRSAEAEARSWDVVIIVLSKARGDRVAAAQAKLVVDPFEQVEADVRPERRHARLAARFALTLSNRANSPVDLGLEATDREQAMSYKFARDRIELAPGDRVPNRLTVRPHRQRWFGSNVEHTIDIKGLPVGSEEVAVAREVTFVQRPWIPRWLAIALPILLAFLLLLFLILPNNTTVPELTQARTVFDAQKLLDEAKLKLSPQAQEEVTRGAEIGTILDQSPAAGEEVEEESEVTIKVGVGSGTVEAPDLAGLSVTEADAQLRDADLTLGAVQPPPGDPAAAQITSQIPAEGEEVNTGSPVNVFVTGGGEASGDTAVVPEVGDSGADAQNELAEEGLTPETVSVIDESPPGTVVGTEPPAGVEVTSGTPVRLLVSAGFPLVAVDNTEDVFVVRGTDGEPVTELASTDEVEEQAAWTPDGERIAYRRVDEDGNGTIVMVEPDGSGEQAITPEGEDFHDPAFAPTTDPLVLAAVRRQDEDGDLCFMEVPTAGEADPECIEDPDFDLGRQLSWAPDGSALLAFAAAADDSSEFGLQRYTSAAGGDGEVSADRDDWSEGEIVTETDEGQRVISGAFSPDGQQMALAAEFDDPGIFHAFVADAGDFSAGGAEALDVRACEVYWREDGLELLVTQRNASCDLEARGPLLRVDPRSPGESTIVADEVYYPSWQPLGASPP